MFLAVIAAWNNGKPQVNGSSDVMQHPKILQNERIGFARIDQVEIRAGFLDIEKEEIGVLGEGCEVVRASVSTGLHAGVNALPLGCGEDCAGELWLHQGFAARESDASPACLPEHPGAQDMIHDQVSRYVVTRHSQCVGVARFRALPAARALASIIGVR